MKNIFETRIVFATVTVLIAVFSFQHSSAQFSFSTQPEKVETRKGNEQFQKENYTDAEASYKKALNTKNNMPEAMFNLGDAMYQQKRYDDAGKQFQLSAQTNTDEKVKAKAYFNQGNSFMEQKKWEDAIKAYKNSLKLNPSDKDAKYNLAYANSKLQKNGGGGESKDNKDEKDKQDKDKQNKDQQNKDQKKDQQQKDQQQQQKDQEQKDKQQQEQKPKLSKEDAEKLLQAMNNEEKKTNEKMQQKQIKGVRVKIKKDW